MLTNIFDALLNSNFRDELGNPVKPRSIKDCNSYGMGS
jgi:hypothetical protein